MGEATASPGSERRTMRKASIPIAWGLLFGTWLGLIIWIATS